MSNNTYKPTLKWNQYASGIMGAVIGVEVSHEHVQVYDKEIYDGIKSVEVIDNPVTLTTCRVKFSEVPKLLDAYPVRTTFSVTMILLNTEMKYAYVEQLMFDNYVIDESNTLHGIPSTEYHAINYDVVDRIYKLTNGGNDNGK